MANAIMIQGTASNAGKSLLAAGLCRIFAQDGYKVAPFKSQNMALNSAITPDGFEMGRAQVVQAEAAGVAPDVRMNPILLKPTSHVGSQVIVNGVPRGTMPAGEYFRYRKSLIPEVMAAYESLAAEYDIIVIEGAGSPAEINLRQDDIVNMGMARRTNAPGAPVRRHRPGGRVRLPLRHGEAAGAGRAGEDQGPDYQQIPGGCGYPPPRPGGSWSGFPASRCWELSPCWTWMWTTRTPSPTA